MSGPPAAPPAQDAAAAPRRRWGGGRALFDGQEAGKLLLLQATERCVARRGTARISMAEVAEDAGVTRSTLYRYFPTRTDLITALLLSRAETFVAAAVASLPDPDDARVSLAPLMLHAVEHVRGTPVTDALFSPQSEGLVAAIELESDAIFEVASRHFRPLLARWQGSGQLQADLDLDTTVRWIIAQAVLLLQPPWRELSVPERRRIVDQYMVRALLAPSP